MLIGPALSGDNPGKIGGAAGNRTRVQSAYYSRVYVHSPGKPEPLQYRAYGAPMEGRPAYWAGSGS
jgi:hypothetical protein